MAKELPYFKFICDEWLTGDITIEDWEVQGFFITICAYYWKKDCNITMTKLKRRYKNAKADLWDILLDAGVIKTKNDKMTITFLDEQWEERLREFTKKSVAGKDGANKRWKNHREKMAKSNTPIKVPMAKHGNIDKEREEDKEREKNNDKEGAEEIALAFSSIDDKALEIVTGLIKDDKAILDDKDNVFNYMQKTLRLKLPEILKISEKYEMEYIIEKIKIVKKKYDTLKNPTGYFMSALSENFHDLGVEKDNALGEKRVKLEEIEAERQSKVNDLLALGGSITNADYQQLPEEKRNTLSYDEEHYIKEKIWIYYDPVARKEKA